MPYSQASDHSVTVGFTKTILLIGTPLVVTCCRNLIRRGISWRCHSWSCCGHHNSPLFSKWISQFNKDCAGGMKCAAWLKFPINDFSVSILICFEANDYFMSVAKAVWLSFGRNYRMEWVCMYHPMHVFFSSNFSSLTSFLKESGSSRLRGSNGCSGRNSIWITNRAALFESSI